MQRDLNSDFRIFKHLLNYKYLGLNFVHDRKSDEYLDYIIIKYKYSLVLFSKLARVMKSETTCNSYKIEL